MTITAFMHEKPLLKFYPVRISCYKMIKKKTNEALLQHLAEGCNLVIF